MDVGRATASGAIRPGNSTMLRTRTMMSAWAGMSSIAPFAAGWRCASARISMSSFRLVSMALRDPSKHQHEAAVDELAGQQLEAARRQRDAALEMAVRDLEAVDRVARGGALPAHRGDHEV